jgi:ribosome biogenesis ATPase
VGGIEQCLQDVRELIEQPMRHPEIYQHLGVRPPTGVLLHGPPGTGKTLLANAIAGELGVPFLSVSAPEIVSGFSGQSEKRIRSLFLEARRKAPCIVFLDEIDAITPKREAAQREMERRIVAQLLTCMDDLGKEDEDGETPPPVMVIGATNRPDSLDPALRRAGRFDREISMGVPDAAARGRILRVLTKKLRLQGDFDYDKLARETPGFVGADLVALTKEAATVSVNRIFHNLCVPESVDAAATDVPDRVDPLVQRAADDALDLKRREIVAAHLRDVGTLSPEELAPLFITMGDFEVALPKVQPSAKREGFATVPDVSWGNVGALDGVRKELQMAIVNAIRFPDAYSALGLGHPAGVLLYGPPGCGKTLLAQAVAHECG